MTHVRITLKEGPVRIISLDTAGWDSAQNLWDSITGSEHFPAGSDTAYYVLSLTRPVSTADDVPAAEADLLRALRLLATTWPFVGGSFLVLDVRETITSSCFESNAEEIRKQLQNASQHKEVSASAVVSYETLAGYAKPPLIDAVAISRAARGDPGLRRLLSYHQSAWVDYYRARRGEESGWFISLYKVRDLLVKIHRSEATARAKLGIPHSEWRHFGSVLNGNDLRHAETQDLVPALGRVEVDRLFALARAWVAAHLRALSLSVT